MTAHDKSVSVGSVVAAAPSSGEVVLRVAAKVYLGVVAALGERVPGESFNYFEAKPTQNEEAMNRWLALNEAGKVLKAAIAESEARATRPTTSAGGDSGEREAFQREMDQWFFRTNKGEKMPFEVCRHSDPEVVSPVVVKAFASFDEAEAYFLDARFSAAMQAARAAHQAPQAECICQHGDFRDGYYELDCPRHGKAPQDEPHWFSGSSIGFCDICGKKHAEGNHRE